MYLFAFKSFCFVFWMQSLFFVDMENKLHLRNIDKEHGDGRCGRQPCDLMTSAIPLAFWAGDQPTVAHSPLPPALHKIPNEIPQPQSSLGPISTSETLQFSLATLLLSNDHFKFFILNWVGCRQGPLLFFSVRLAALNRVFHRQKQERQRAKTRRNWNIY